MSTAAFATLVQPLPDASTGRDAVRGGLRAFAGARVRRASPSAAVVRQKAVRRGVFAKADLGVLFQPLTIDEGLTLKNRLVMAPMTRCMAGEGLVPTEDMAAYYARRAGMGLIISEATVVRPDGQGYPQTPGMFTEEQVKGWKAVTDRVHDNGGTIFCQLWHCGRTAHRFFTGTDAVAPSAIALEGRVPRTELQYEVPRAMETDEIPDHVASWRDGAEMARAAGFDGVEIHGANGYIVDQFLHGYTNRRTDEYGGTPEKRARFAVDVVDACIAGFGSSTRVGIRLSPAAAYQMEYAPGDEKTYPVLLKELAERRLAFVHCSTGESKLEYEYLGGTTSQFLRRFYKGTLIGVGNYTPEEAAAHVASKEVDMAAIGRLTLSNPNYAELVRDGRTDEIKPFGPETLGTLY